MIPLHQFGQFGAFGLIWRNLVVFGRFGDVQLLWTVHTGPKMVISESVQN